MIAATPHGAYIGRRPVEEELAPDEGALPDAPPTLVPHSLQKRAPATSALPQLPHDPTASAAPH